MNSAIKIQPSYFKRDLMVGQKTLVEAQSAFQRFRT